MTTDLRDRLQLALGSGYELGRELGGGGMSRVFLAQDARLGRSIVVKVLASELTEGMSAERFEREIRLAARLQHPNVVPVLAAGEHDGLAYYTMPFVEGESLRARLTRGGLSIEAAVSVLRDVARALEYAHGHGVVHRDVKPENVLLAGSAAAVADFGIAKALDAARTVDTTGASAAGAAAHETLTRIGTSLGTPAYMAPEQAAGDPSVDARADLYAWGVVAYEVLAGATPFAGRAPHQLVAAHIGEAPPPLSPRAPNAPPDLVALVMRCLEKDPARRPQSAGDLLAALEAVRTPSGARTPPPPAQSKRPRIRIAVSIIGVVLVLGAVLTAYLLRRPKESVPIAVAVLPFENLGEAADAYFADGLTDEVRSRLVNIPGLRVISERSARQYKGSIREIAHELGATHILTAKVRWARSSDGGGRVRVSPTLVRAADEAIIWSDPYEGPLADVFKLQASVAERVAAALDVAIGGGDRAPPDQARTKNLAAYDAFLRGLANATYAKTYSTSARKAAIEQFERAVALDPGFAAAHARLALAYWTEMFVNPRGTDMGDKVRVHVERAVALDSTLLETQLARAHASDADEANRVLQLAARRWPQNAELQYELGETQLLLGHPDAAIPYFQRAEVLEPRWAGPPGQLAAAYDRVHRHEEALGARAREMALLPTGSLPRVFQASSYLLWRADTIEARRFLETSDLAVFIDDLTRLPSPAAGRAIWTRVVPAAVMTAKDTITLEGYTRSDWGTPDVFHLMKARHFAFTGKGARVVAHADSIIALLEPVLRKGARDGRMGDLFPQSATLAEAYAYAGRKSDAARMIDRYVDEVRSRPEPFSGPGALVTAAYVDVLINRKDLAVSRLTEALQLPSGLWISPALLRADPSWAPLRGHPGFERLIALNK